MQTALRAKPHQTLADYWAAAGISGAPAWAGEITLAKTPFKHQILDLNHLASEVRSGLWSDPGIGKTLPAQAHVLWLVSLGNRALCVMPPVLVPQFHASFHANFPGIEEFVTISTFMGDVAKRNGLLEKWRAEGWPQVLIMSNDMFSGKSPTELQALQRKREQIAERKGEEPKPLSLADEANVALWKRQGYNHLLLDEATSVKTPGSDLHKAVKQFVGQPDHTSNGLVLMTGSPIDNTPTDAYGLVALITPNRYGSYRAFERIHVRTDPFSKYPKVIGYENMDYLWQSLYLKGRRVTKAEALDLPPRLVTEIPVELAKPHLELYRKLVKERVLELGEKVIDATTAASLFVKTQRMLLCPELFHEGKWTVENTLLTTLDEVIKGIPKVIVFCWFTESVKKVTERYAKLNPAQLYGETSGADRGRQKNKFITDPTCKMMVINPRSGGIGLDGLQTVCSHVVFAESVTTPGLWDQSIARLHRSGQKSAAINIYLLTALGTVAVKQRNNLLRKEHEANQVVRDTKVLLADLLGEGGVQGTLT